MHEMKRTWPGALAAALLLGGAGAGEAAVLVVTQNAVAYQHFTTIQDAVNAAQQGDWILIDKGVYPGAVYITTPNLHVRGMDRNDVIVDGQHQVGNGIEVWKANGVTIENLTVRNFDRPSLDGPNGNEIWWNGGDGSGVIGLSGWTGRYLTTYDDGLLGGYGLFASNSINGFLDNVYASGFNDSGLYIGACRDCRAKVRHALIENNALGYAGIGAGIAERVVLDERVADLCTAIAAGADVQPRVVESGPIHVVEEAVDRVRGEETVAAEQPVVVGGEVPPRPARQPDHTRAVAAVPPDLVAVRTVQRRPVEVAHGEVLDRDAVRLPHLDAVADLVLPVDDHVVAVHPAHVEVRRRDVDRAGIDALVDQDPVSLLRGVDRVLDGGEVLVSDRVLRDHQHRRLARSSSPEEQRGGESPRPCPFHLVHPSLEDDPRGRRP